MNLSLLLFSRTQPGLFIWSEMYKVAHLTDSIITVFTIIFHLNSRTDAFMFRLYTSGITSIKLIVHVLTISSNTYSVVYENWVKISDFSALLHNRGILANLANTYDIRTISFLARFEIWSEQTKNGLIYSYFMDRIAKMPNYTTCYTFVTGILRSFFT